MASEGAERTNNNVVGIGSRCGGCGSATALGSAKLDALSARLCGDDLASN